jgi:hypothetical protein
MFLHAHHGAHIAGYRSTVAVDYTDRLKMRQPLVATGFVITALLIGGCTRPLESPSPTGPSALNTWPPQTMRPIPVVREISGGEPCQWGPRESEECSKTDEDGGRTEIPVFTTIPVADGQPRDQLEPL